MAKFISIIMFTFFGSVIFMVIVGNLLQDETMTGTFGITVLFMLSIIITLLISILEAVRKVGK